MFLMIIYFYFYFPRRGTVLWHVLYGTNYRFESRATYGARNFTAAAGSTSTMTVI